MRFANRLLLLSTVAALDGLATSHEALAGCFPSPTPGDDTITCSAIIPPPIIPFLDLSNGGRDRVTIQSGTILGNVTFPNNQPSSLTMNNGLIGGSVFSGGAQNAGSVIAINGGQIFGNITPGGGQELFNISNGVVGSNVNLGDSTSTCK